MYAKGKTLLVQICSPTENFHYIKINLLADFQNSLNFRHYQIVHLAFLLLKLPIFGWNLLTRENYYNYIFQGVHLTCLAFVLFQPELTYKNQCYARVAFCISSLDSADDFSRGKILQFFGCQNSFQRNYYPQIQLVQ